MLFSVTKFFNSADTLTITLNGSGDLNLKRNRISFNILRPSFCILVFLFASPILYLYHSGLLFKPTEGDAGAQHNKTIKSHPNKHNGARPQVGSDNKTHVESFDTGFGFENL